MGKLVIVDGNSLANRAYYALPFLTNSKAQPSGAIYGFANILIKIITDYSPDGIVVAFDHARKTFRTEMYAEYKGTRKPTPPELISQFPLIKDMLSLMNINVIEQNGIEADDIIGTISKNSNCDKIILSGDRDLLQLIDENTEVWLTIKGVTEILKVNEQNLEEHFEIEKPCQIIDLKALMGDSSDNIPGVKGIGEKIAKKLIKEHGSLDEIYATVESNTKNLAEKLTEGKTMAYLSKELATIKVDCDFPFDLNKTSYTFPFSQEIYEFFDKWNFNSITKRKDIFEDSIELADNNANLVKTKIQTLDDVKKLKSEIKNEFAYSLEKLEFSVNKDLIYYVEPTIDMFNDNVDFDDVLLELKDVFEDKNILKLTNSAKSDLYVFDKLGITLTNYFDLTIANYLMYTGLTMEKSSKLSINQYFSKKTQYETNMKEMGVDKLFYDCELPLVEVLFDMEKCGFKIDKQMLDEIDASFSSELQEVTKEIHELAGEEFNINSPKMVARILFEKLELKSFNNKKQSTSNEILQDIAWQHPIVEKIMKYRKYQKFKTSYIEVYKKICDMRGNIVHTQFNQTLTNTGRLSSSEPNLQNIPTRDEDGKILRKIFVSKFDNGELVSADYNQIELRLLADMSEEEKLIQSYEEGGDIHTYTASQIFGIPMNQVTSLQRRTAKAVNFGIIYGISEYGLSQTLHVAYDESKNYIKSYFEKYPKVKEFNESNIAFAKKNGYIKTKFGRIRHIPEINASSYNLRTFAERVAMNMPLQGTASDIIKFAMIEVYQTMQKSKLKSQLILQIHDELIVDVYPGELESVKKILKESMENIAKLNVPLVVNMNSGKNLFECKD